MNVCVEVNQCDIYEFENIILISIGFGGIRIVVVLQQNMFKQLCKLNVVFLKGKFFQSMVWFFLFLKFFEKFMNILKFLILFYNFKLIILYYCNFIRFILIFRKKSICLF